MKKLLSIAALVLLGLQLSAQNVQKDTRGNYIAVKKQAEPGANTGKTYTDLKGNVYPVYESKNGKLYVEKTSKSGNVYRMYLKVG